MTRLPISVLVLAATASCLRKTNPYYCADHPDHNCTVDGGLPSCTDNLQCPASLPICRGDQHCHGCTFHGECPASNMCLPEGACADRNKVAYASSAMGTDNTTCSMDMPCTSIMAALRANRDYLKLQGTFDEPVVIDNRTMTIMADPGTVLTRSTPGDIISIGGMGAIGIYDLAINNASGTGAGVLVLSSGNHAVTLYHVSMSGNNGAGGAVVVGGGKITILRSKIFNNMSGGIAITSADFDIENNFITGNGDVATTGYGGISLSQTNAGSRILSFNTISGNIATNDNAVGVSCSSLARDLTASNNIVYGNIASGTGTQVGGSHCLWTYSDIGPGPDTSGTGNSNVDPRFVDANGGDFHLQSSSPVIDKAHSDTMVDIDIDGDARPQGAGWDIGADEYKPR